MEINIYYQLEYVNEQFFTTVIKESADKNEFDVVLDILRRLKMKGKLHLILYGYVIDELSHPFEGTDKPLYHVRTEII